MKLAALALSLTLTPLLFMPAAQAETTLMRLRDRAADAHFVSVSGCISTYVDVFASTSAIRLSGGSSSGQFTYAIVLVLQRDEPANGPTCGVTVQALRDDVIEMPASSLQIDEGRGTASLSGVATSFDQGTTEARLYNISLSWRPNGTPVVLHSSYAEDFGSVSVKEFGLVRERPAIASGSVVEGGVNFISAPTTDARITALRNGSIEITRK